MKMKMNLFFEKKISSQTNHKQPQTKSKEQLASTVSLQTNGRTFEISEKKNRRTKI